MKRIFSEHDEGGSINNRLTNQKRWEDLEFKHFIDFPMNDCIFCSTRVRDTGRTRLFLICHADKSVYIRNGVKNQWEEVRDRDDCEEIHSAFRRAIADRSVPCFRAETTMFDLNDSTPARFSGSD